MTAPEQARDCICDSDPNVRWRCPVHGIAPEQARGTGGLREALGIVVGLAFDAQGVRHTKAELLMYLQVIEKEARAALSQIRSATPEAAIDDQ